MAAIALAIQTQAPEGYTPEEERAVATTMECLKGHVDTVPQRERRRRDEALIEEAFGVCTDEEAALRALLRSRFNEQSTERAIEIVRTVSRDGMRRYIRR